MLQLLDVCVVPFFLPSSSPCVGLKHTGNDCVGVFDEDIILVERFTVGQGRTKKVKGSKKFGQVQGFCLPMFKTFALTMIKTDPNHLEKHPCGNFF